MKTILEHDENEDIAKKRELSLPLKDDDTEYTLEGLYPDQVDVVTVVLDKIKEFLECKNLSNFAPLRLIINGAGGSGKSVIINTVVTCPRKMFNTDGVVRVVAPTGTAAFNVHGQTFHHLLGNRVTVNSYLPNTMSKSKKMKLIKKLKLSWPSSWTKEVWSPTSTSEQLRNKLRKPSSKEDHCQNIPLGACRS